MALKCALALLVALVAGIYFGCEGISLDDLAKASKNFQCGVPQPRSISYTEFLPNETQVQPRMIVLHRCDSGSGCCLQSGECFPKTIQEVELSFAVLRGNSFGKIIRVQTKNHTSCICRSKKDLPK